MQDITYMDSFGCKPDSGCPTKGKVSRMAQATTFEKTTVIESEEALVIESHGHMAKDDKRLNHVSLYKKKIKFCLVNKKPRAT